MKVLGMPQVNWANKESVVAFAIKCGKGMSVVYNGNIYNIVHTSNLHRLLNNRTVVHQT